MDAPSADRFGLAGATLAGRYRVERQVAEGGFAVVYRAVQIALERPIALKVLKTPPGLGDAARVRFESRFATEARTIAKLQHPYIVDVYDYGVSPMPSGESAPWMALEWLDGETLEHELDRRRGGGGRSGRRSVADAVALLRPVIDAVAYAHRRGVVHRDIKPANMMIVDSDAGPMLRMLDFGIAKIMEGDPIGDTRPGRGSGAPGFSPDYAAPEQITYARTGPWTDVHALGLLLTELLTGDPPFAAERDEVLFEQITAADRPTPARKGVDAGGLERVIAKALALAPGQRWKDAGELLEAVAGCAGGEAPVRARAPRARYAVLRRRLRAAASRMLAARPWRRMTGATLRIRRPRDLALPVSGGVAILSLFVLLVWAAASGGGRSRGVAVRAISAGAVSPWIVPIPACASGTDLTAAVAPPVAARRPSRISRPPAAAPAVAAAPGAAAEPASCLVSVNSVPWSEVWIDGKNTGRHTPFVDVEIGCGPHRIDFKRPDLQIAESESIVVRPGETFKRRYTLPGGAE
ncbi:MAG TPA: serine/threonine-protein kinase [Polyangia bacterium]